MPLVRQNERDYKSLGDAVTSGRITAEPGMSVMIGVDPHKGSRTRYVPSEEDPGTCTFAEQQTYDWDAVTAESSQGGKPRVYQIAKEFRVESKVVMAKLQEMGVFVRSPAATVEPEVLRQLWEHFEAPASRRRPSQPSSTENNG